MNALLLAAGCLLVAVAVTDAVVTALSLFAGAGTLSGRMGGLLWRAMLAVHRKRRGSGRWLRWSGLSILMATFAMWTALLWGGWFCVFLSDDAAVVAAKTGQPADTTSRAYFAGYTAFTFGNGDYAPGPGWPQVLSAVASLTGLFLITLSLTYFLQVVQAVVHKRHVAQLVHALGPDGPGIVARGWAGKRFTSMFNQHLVSLTEPLLLLGEQHLAYPVAHYFHAPTAAKSPARAVAALDEALLLLTGAVAPRYRPDPAATGPLSDAVGMVLASLRPEFFPRLPQPLPPVRRTRLRAYGIPTVGAAAFAESVRRRAGRRAAVHGFLRSDGWD